MPSDRLLVVDDPNPLTASLCDALRGLGYDVAFSGTGPEGLARALEGGWDCVVLEIALAGMDGFEVLTKLRAAGQRVPVLVLSARGRLEDRVRGLELGADDYLCKPAERVELIARIRAVIRRSRV